MLGKIRLVDIVGPTAIQIDVEITAEGDLLFSGYDIGRAPRETFDDSDYEYWLRIKAAEKDQVLLALIEKIYTGRASVISELQEYLGSKGIPCEFSSYS